MNDTKINAADHLGLVGYIANKYHNCGIEYDDVFSAGSLGLVKAANTFDVSRGFKFATYAARCINNEILMMLRKAPKHNALSLTRHNDEQNDDCDFSCDYEIAYFEKYDKIDDLLSLKPALEQLEERDRKLIYLRYFRNMSQVEVGKIIGVEQSYISRLEKRALKKLKEYMQK
jgi:RNA polymerase sporulation-specific sigma factor